MESSLHRLPGLRGRLASRAVVGEASASSSIDLVASIRWQPGGRALETRKAPRRTARGLYLDGSGPSGVSDHSPSTPNDISSTGTVFGEVTLARRMALNDPAAKATGPVPLEAV